MMPESHASRIIAGLVLFLFSTGLCSPALADSKEDPRLKRARHFLQYGEYGDAISLLVELLYPVRLERRKDAETARELLGVCYFYVGDLDKARYEFVELLKMEPGHKLDPLLYPPPLVEFFDSIRTEIEEELARIKKERLAAERERKKKEEERKKHQHKVEKVYIEKHSKKHSLPLVFVPFGVGQFQNGDYYKGIAFLGGEGALLALNVISYHVIQGMKNPDGTIPSSEIEAAKGLRITQMVSLAAMIGLAVYGIIDAWINFKPYEVEFKPAEKVVPKTIGGSDKRHGNISSWFTGLMWRF